MGVPAFFRWLCQKYPSIVIECIEEKSKIDPVTEQKIPVNTSQPNPNGIEYDNLYLDMNGIIHPCTHPEDRPAPKTEDEMMILIFEFIDRIFSIVRPRKLLYMAIDGVAPRAKMNQQRSRRFRAAKESFEKSAEIKRLKEQIISNGGTVPFEIPHSEKFDSNCITPGTPFMHRLAECLRYYIHERLNSDPGWKNLIVILSDANVPGEGEHKIMDFIRHQRANPNHDPNTHHVLCGADADLIMLGLATHEPNFTIIREEFRPDRPRPCEICAQFGHETKVCQGLKREKSGVNDELANSFTPIEQRFIFLRLSILREYLNHELNMPNLPFKFDLERAIDDWVFLCFFVGNDFLPHLPSLEIREGAIDRLVKLYKSIFYKSNDYLTDSGNVNLKWCQQILNGLGEVEDDIFKRRQQNQIEFKKRQNERRSMQTRTGCFGASIKPETIGSSMLFEDNLLKTNQNSINSIKRKHNDENEEIEVPIKQTKEDELPERSDTIRLWENGWKQRYYKIKFNALEDDFDFRQKVAHHYTIGLQWVLKYYYQGVPSWDWYFPYHYAPFASDFIEIELAEAKFESRTEPFKPFEQLMAVFPSASRKHIPDVFHKLMTEKSSPIIDFYPEDFKIDLNGKKQSWQGVALLPFIDEIRLKNALNEFVPLLSSNERKLNKKGYDRLFVRKSNKLYKSFKHMYLNLDNESKQFRKLKYSTDLDPILSRGIAGKFWSDKHVVLKGQTYFSPIKNVCPDVVNNRVLSVHYHNPIYEPNYVFKSKILDGAKLPDVTFKNEEFNMKQRNLSRNYHKQPVNTYPANKINRRSSSQIFSFRM